MSFLIKSVLAILVVCFTSCTQTREQIEPVSYEIPNMFSAEVRTKEHTRLPFEELKEKPDFSQMSVVAVGGGKQSEETNQLSEEQ